MPTVRAVLRTSRWKLIEQRFDVTQIGAAKALAITEVSPKSDAGFSANPDLLPSHLGFDEPAAGLTEYDVFESITRPGKMLLLTSWKSAEDSARWGDLSPAFVVSAPTGFCAQQHF
jgi:hypothetical protein